MNAPSSSSFETATITVEAATAALLMTVAVYREKFKKTRRQNFLRELSLAPSIFNIKARGLAHCLHWMKLS